jgi:hypothetical protein
VLLNIMSVFDIQRPDTRFVAVCTRTRDVKFPGPRYLSNVSRRLSHNRHYPPQAEVHKVSNPTSDPNSRGWFVQRNVPTSCEITHIIHNFHTECELNAHYT